MLDNLYAAARRGDRSSLCDLIYAKRNKRSSSSRDAGKKNVFRNLTENFDAPLVKIKSGDKRKAPPLRTLPCPTKKALLGTDSVDFTNVVNTRNSRSVPPKQGENLSVKPMENNLIDYTVLTSALSKTLESKLREGEDNDVKIVIFCNNKPIQSFSVKNNSKSDKAVQNQSDSVQNCSSNTTDKSPVLETLYNFQENQTPVQTASSCGEKQSSPHAKTVVGKSNGPVTAENAVAKEPQCSPGNTSVATSVVATNVLVTSVASTHCPALTGPFQLSHVPVITSLQQPAINPTVIQPVDGGVPKLSHPRATVQGTVPGTLLASRQGPVVRIPAPVAPQKPGTPQMSVVPETTLNAGPRKILPNVLNQVVTSVNGQVPFITYNQGPVVAGNIVIPQSLVAVPASGYTSDARKIEVFPNAETKQSKDSKQGKDAKLSTSSPESDDDVEKLVISEVVGSARKARESQNLKDTDENGNEPLFPVKCDQCNKSFKLKRYLNRHKIRVHRETSDKPKTETTSTHGKGPGAESDSNKGGKAGEKNDISSDIDQLLGDKFVNLNDLIPDSADSDKTDGHVRIKIRVDNSDEDDAEQRVKREPSAESEDSVTKYINSIIDDHVVLEEVNFADKGKRSLYHKSTEYVKGETAETILAGVKNKPTRLLRNENGFPVTPDGVIEPVYVCEECGKFYRARKTLKDHYFREHAQSKEDEPLYLYITGNKYQCPICFNNFHSGSELVAHTKKHTGELQIPCKLCGKIYSSVHVLRRHIENIHAETRPRPFQCELCDYAASNKWHLKEHYRRHTGK